MQDLAAQQSAWADAVLAAALLAVDPQGLGGAAVRAHAGPVRDQWLALLRAWLPPHSPWQRLPLHIQDERLLGGLDLTATLATGRPVAQRGLLSQAHGGAVLVAMAERLPVGTAARLCMVMDQGEVRIERDGIAQTQAARFCLLALDEGDAADECAPPALVDRLAFQLALGGISPRQAQIDSQGFETDSSAMASDTAAARARLPAIRHDDAAVQTLCQVALALGIDSLRAPLLALRVARAHAALLGDDEVAAEHLSLAARLVLAPRATLLPAPPPEPEEQAQESEPEPQDDNDEPPDQAPPEDAAEPPPEHDEAEPDEPQPPPDPETLEQLQDTVLAAAQAAIPAGLLAQLQLMGPRGGAQSRGGAGAVQTSLLRGRPAGTWRGRPGGGARLHLMDTLRAAAPWQRLRQLSAGAADEARRIRVMPEDFHVSRFRQRRETTALFVVDASGSSAMNRLAEAKGAVELLLADCYVRRDKVAVLAFRGRSAELLLPPTRSLVRAKRSLAQLPGGGGTPLAHAIDATAEIARTISRRGDTPLVVLLTDGRANVTREGGSGRAQAEQDALESARRLGAQGVSVLLVDTSAQPHAQARALAQAMRASYLPLPYAGAQTLSQVVRQASQRTSAAGGFVG